MNSVLEDFAGKSRSEIVESLEGFQEFRLGDLCSVFINASRNHMIKISTAPEAAEAFAQVCKAANTNKFLPNIQEHGTVSESLHITVMERLKPVADYKAEDRPNREGVAYAIASFAEGTDETHEAVYLAFENDADFVTAVDVLVKGLEEASDKVRYQPTAESICYRTGENAGSQAVFVNPFRPVAANEDCPPSLDTKSLRKRLKSIKSRGVGCAP